MRWLVIIALTGCIRTSSVTCGDGHVCAADRVCDDRHETCVYPDQLTSCLDKPDSTPCTINGVPGGICNDQVCIAPTCGDGIAVGAEICDGNDIPAVGTCVDFAFDYGPLSCSPLCTEGFDRCRRLGWQLRSLTGTGWISAIWEDGDDLWVANQNGILHRRQGAWQPIVQPGPGNAGWNSIWGSGGRAVAVANNGFVAHYDGTVWTSREIETGSIDHVTGVWGRSPTDVYAVGGKNGARIWHFDGNEWSSERLPLGSVIPPLTAVWGTATTVVAVGNGGAILRLDRGTWVQDNSQTTHNLTSVWGSDDTNVIAVGNPPGALGDATIIRFDGLDWSAMKTPLLTHRLNGVSGRSANEIYAVGGRDGSNILYWDGASWTPMVTNVQGAALELNAVHAGGNGVYAAKRPSLFLEYEDAGWLEADGSAAAAVRGLWASGAEYAVAVGDGLGLQENNQGKWTFVPYPTCWGATNFVFDVWGSSRDDVWIGGPYGKLMHKTLSDTTCFALPSLIWVADMWGSGATDIWAVGAYQTNAEPKLEHYNGVMWSDSSVLVRPYVARLRGVWGFSATDVWVVGDSKVLHYDGATWSDAGLVTTHHLTSIWGSSPTDLFVVGSAGAIFHYDGTAWTQMVVPLGLTTPTDQEWLRVHGTASNDVYVVGRTTLLRYDGASWAPISRLSPGSVDAVWALPNSVLTGGELGNDPRLIGRLQ